MKRLIFTREQYRMRLASASAPIDRTLWLQTSANPPLGGPENALSVRNAMAAALRAAQEAGGGDAAEFIAGLLILQR